MAKPGRETSRRLYLFLRTTVQELRDDAKKRFAGVNQAASNPRNDDATETGSSC